MQVEHSVDNIVAAVNFKSVRDAKESINFLYS